MEINEQNFHDIDLNLMVTFAVLFRELSVTRTAALLNVGQPAVSGGIGAPEIALRRPAVSQDKKRCTPNGQGGRNCAASDAGLEPH
ncbi:LysR family transcriptional regulator [Pseudomonas lini]